MQEMQAKESETRTDVTLFYHRVVVGGFGVEDDSGHALTQCSNALCRQSSRLVASVLHHARERLRQLQHHFT